MVYRYRPSRRQIRFKTVKSKISWSRAQVWITAKQKHGK